MQENGPEKEGGKALLQESRRPKRQAGAGRAPLKETEIIWVSITLSLILFLVFSSQLLIFIPYFVFDMPYDPARMASTLAQVLVPFNIGAALILFNYYKCVTMDAGSVPVDYTIPPDVHLTPEETRYCRVCKVMKPPRSHHCRTCKRCVLRMDHHCPWIANCVGQANYASFMRFLAAVDITCAGHLVLCGLRVADYWWTREGAVWRRPSTFTMVVLILNFALCIPTFALVGAFSIYHFWCLCTNTTTIEGWERDKVERLITKGRIEDMDYPFDLGTLKNIQSVLGRNPLTWCIPSTTCGDGLHFEVDEGIDDIEQYRWPPRDPARAAASHREDRRRAKLPPGGPFTYGNNSFNPALQPTSGASRHTSTSQIAKSALPPWHPDYGQPDSDEELLEGEEDDAAQAAGVDTGSSCLPPGTIPGSQDNRPNLRAKVEEESDSDEDEGSAGQPPTSSLVRRGSEGYEVRPKRYDVAYAATTEGSQEGYRRPTYDEYYDDHEGFYEEDYGDDNDDEEDEDSDIDGKQWDWRRQKEEEDKLREMLEDEMRRTGATAALDPPPDWQMPDDDHRAEDSTSSSAVLLPSQIMRRRNQWHQLMNEQPA